MYNYKMKIVFDKERALKDNVSIENLYSLVDGMFNTLNLKVIAVGECIDCGREEDYER